MSTENVKRSIVMALKAVTAKVCAYTHGDTPASMCDCKYGVDEDTADNMSETGNGCPEMRTAMAVIDALTPSEFERVAKRIKKRRWWSFGWDALDGERRRRKNAEETARIARAAAMKLGARLSDMYLYPGPGVVARCSRGFLGLITSEKVQKITYPDGNTGWAWTGIHLKECKWGNADDGPVSWTSPGAPWSSRNPEVVCSIDQLEGFLENRSKESE